MVSGDNKDSKEEICEENQGEKKIKSTGEQQMEENIQDFQDTSKDGEMSNGEEKVTVPKQDYDFYKEKACEAENLTKRVKADFENYKRSIEKEKETFKEYSLVCFLEKLLPVLDTFEQAMNTTKYAEEKKGIGLIYSQFLDVLHKEGLRPIESEGKLFDPYKHEILMQEECEQEDGTIIEEFQKGYMFKDRVLRYSKVKVAKKSCDENGKKSQVSGDQ